VSDRFGPLIRARAAAAGLNLADELVDNLAAYLALLARWDRKINLTAFDLDSPSDAAIDRLIVEPLQASQLIAPSDRVLIDIGSGGGSPAIPLRLARPQLRAVLVDARERKAAFLREVGRELGLDDLVVAAERFEAFALRPDFAARGDVLTMRAVRPDRSIWESARQLLSPGGRFLWFADIGEKTNVSGFSIDSNRIESPVVVLRQI
jgi:16S rRNA (guanine527-N7)-methyltransferase